MIIILFSHILSDYYFQSDKIAKNKGTNIKYMFLHMIPILVTNLLLIFFFFGFTEIYIGFWLTLIHLVIDIITSGLIRIRLSKNKFINHMLDQSLHVFSMLLIYLIILKDVHYSAWFNRILEINIFTSYGVQYLVVLTACLFLLKPVRILIDDLLEVTVGNFENAQELKKSYYLGYIERLITFFTVATFNYLFISALIGFKTWAQSEKLKKNENDFSKRYLIGTLASLLSSIIIAIIMLWYFQKIEFPLLKIE